MRPEALTAHGRQHSLHDAYDADDVQVEDPAELAEVELLDGLVVQAHAGIVDHTVDAPGVSSPARRAAGRT